MAKIIPFPVKRVNILFDGSEYRVPGTDRREISAYYTNDKQDAIDTAFLIWGQEVQINIRRRLVQ